MLSPSHLLPDPTSNRELVHAREVTLQAFRRGDGNWDLEAILQDVKPRDIETALRKYPAGVPVHLMAVRLTVTPSLQVVGAVAAVNRAPFAGVCNGVESLLEPLVGTNLLKGFRREVADRIGPLERCTHISELLSLFPTLAVQAGVRSGSANEASKEPPAQMNRCRGWRADGEAVRIAYPTWHVLPQ
ncbi:hypothetical protein AWB68_07902 [Caballeronia choica]|jgi:Protein of unknown function (DUF2889)|uniref:DUF2889 domain-containing protein n=1 Tax=Caballeronia choica TaxID=326476 RepID=A0A158KY78_9BURK|nr:DUF2889 domain-containing protein [Caballeronia choica]SAL86074.1 hypothetical protein AWB68_07902 [Caballeronia choica]